MSRRFIGAVLVIAGFALSAHAQAPLEWKYKKGDQFYLRNVSSTKQTVRMQKPDGKKVENTRNSSEQTVVLGFTVVDVTAEKNIILKETIEEVHIKPTGGKDPRPAYSDSTIVGASFTIEISPKGEIRKFDGYDKLIGQLAGDDQTAGQALLAILQEDALKKTVREVLLFLPDTPAKEGMKWEQTIDEPFGALGTLHETRKFQYAGKADSGGKMLDKITFTTDATYSTEGKKVGDHPYFVREGKVVVDPQNAKGTILFDATAGRLVEIKSAVNLKGTFAVSISNVRVDIEVEQEQTSLVELLNQKPPKKGS